MMKKDKALIAVSKHRRRNDIVWDEYRAGKLTYRETTDDQSRRLSDLMEKHELTAYDVLQIGIYLEAVARSESIRKTLERVEGWLDNRFPN